MPLTTPGRAWKNALAEASQLRCRRRDNSCLGTHITRTDLSMTSPATASCVHRDRGSSFYATYEWSPVASVPGLWRRLPSVPGLRSLYEVQRVRPQSGDRALRRRAAPSSCLDVYQRGQGSVQAEKAVGRTGLRNHQRATGGTEVPAARHGQRVGRVDSVGDCLQPAHPLAGVVPLHLR